MKWDLPKNNHQYFGSILIAFAGGGMLADGLSRRGWTGTEWFALALLVGFCLAYWPQDVIPARKRAQDESSHPSERGDMNLDSSRET